MTMTEAEIHGWFLDHGFHLTYRSAAIELLAHAELPGIEVRIGTTHVVVERDGDEIYRSLHRQFDPDVVRERVFGP